MWGLVISLHDPACNASSGLCCELTTLLCVTAEHDSSMPRTKVHSMVLAESDPSAC